MVILTGETTRPLWTNMARYFEKYPARRDSALFEMGIIYAYPDNEQKDYQKSLECFQKLLKNYPGSRLRADGGMDDFYITNVIIKDKVIGSQQKEIETLGKRSKARGVKLFHCSKKWQRSKNQFFPCSPGRTGRYDSDRKKKARRLKLITQRVRCSKPTR